MRLPMLQVRDVSFSYPARAEAPVLSELTIMLPHGKVTAVVGRSGAGKSTVANLLARQVTCQDSSMDSLCFKRQVYERPLLSYSGFDIPGLDVVTRYSKSKRSF